MTKAGQAAEGAKGPDYYNGIFHKSEKHECHYADSEKYPVWKWMVGRLKSLLTENPSIVEVGSGTGQLAHYLHDAGFKTYLGIDFSEVALAMARARVPDKLFALGDIQKPQWYRAGWIDVILACDVLEHLDDDLLVLGQIRKGTHLVFSVPTEDSAGHVRYFSSREDVLGRYGDLLEHLELVSIGQSFVGHGIVNR